MSAPTEIVKLKYFAPTFLRDEHFLLTWDTS